MINLFGFRCFMFARISQPVNELLFTGCIIIFWKFLIPNLEASIFYEDSFYYSEILLLYVEA